MNVTVADSPFDSSPVSQPPPSDDVALCGVAPLLVNLTLVPVVTVVRIGA